MLKVDTQAIKANVENLRSLSTAKFMAVVKNNGYGHGLVETARAAEEGGADWLGVVHVSEGVILREAGIELPILALGWVAPAELEIAINYKIDVPVTSLEQLAAFRSVIPTHAKLRIHLKVETGLNRLGLTGNDLVEVGRLTGLINRQATQFSVIGVYSHLAAVEEAEYLYTLKQAERFQQACLRIRVGVQEPCIRHLSATAATILMPDLHFDMVRCGIGIYGLWPSAETWEKSTKPIGFLKPALSWVETIVQIKNVAIGEAVGYGCTWRPTTASRVAILPIGYADGLPRAMSNKGQVVVGGQACPIVGRICTNITFVDITATSAKIGDEAYILAADHASPVSVDAQAERIGTINYELVTRLPSELARSY